MTDPSPDAPSPNADHLNDSWLERARTASVTLLALVERNPHGAFPTGLPVEPWQLPPHPLHPPE
ncbi:MAG: hypothetical protein ACREQM_08275 [Candidatus Dormibacteraceae bacterium]